MVISLEKKLVIYTLGPPDPCAKCKKTKKNMEKALEELSLREKVEYSHKDIKSKEIIEKYGILQGPAVIVNDILISQGHVPSIKKLKDGINKILSTAK
ncbi:MAG: thioredoxin family protein [Promethearchaeia archaeon]